jgi:hypothetical protein
MVKLVKNNFYWYKFNKSISVIVKYKGHITKTSYEMYRFKSIMVYCNGKLGFNNTGKNLYINLFKKDIRNLKPMLKTDYDILRI